MIRDKSIERKKSTRSKSHSKQKPLSLAGCPLYPLQNFQGFFSSSLTNRALSTCSTAAWTEHAQTDTDTPLPLGLPKAQLFKHAWQTLSSYASPSVSDSQFSFPHKSTTLLFHGDRSGSPGKRSARREAGVVAFGHHGMQLGRREHHQQQLPPWMGSTALLLWSRSNGSCRRRFWYPWPCARAWALRPQM